MDDLDHSVYIAEQDWDCFFQESEECNLQQVALAGLDDSGLSDFDEAEFCLSNQEVRPRLVLGPLGSRSSIDSSSDSEGPPVEPHENSKDIQGPKDSLCAGGNEEAMNVFFESTVASGDDEDTAGLSYAGQAGADLPKDSSLDEPQGATWPAGACCSAHGGEVYHETPRDCEDAIGSTSREPVIQTNAATTINLSAESVPQGEIVLHASNCADVKFALSSLQAYNEHGYYRANSEGEACSVLKGSQGEMNMEIEESDAGQLSLMRPSTSFIDPQKGSMNVEAQSDANIPARAENLSDCDKPARKEKERWFVTVNSSQTNSRDKTWPPVKKKRRKKSCSEDGPELGTGSEGQDSDLESNSGAVRLGVSEPQSQEMYNNPNDCRPAAEGSCSSESTEPIPLTTAQHHKFRNDPSLLMLSQELLPIFQTTCEFDKNKVNYQKSQHIDNHLEQQKVSIGSNLQINPNHQNLLVKLLFSTQSDTGCEMLVFCKDSHQENLPFSEEERASQEDALCLLYSQTERCPERSIFSSETSIPIESLTSSYAFDATPGFHSLDKCLSADNQVDLESKKFLQITEVPKPSGLLVSEINNGSGEPDQSNVLVTPDKVQNSPEMTNTQLIHSEDTSMVCLYGGEGGAPGQYVIPERDSTLSASANTQPLTVTVNSCLLSADQQSIEKKPYLEPATLHPVDITVSNAHSVDLSPNKSSVMMLRDSISHDPERNKDVLTGDGLCLRSENVSQADSADNFTFPECMDRPLDVIKGEVQELDREETLAEDTPTAGLSAAESPEFNNKSTLEDEPVLPKEPVFHTGDRLEDREPDLSLDSTRPVYAISSFWDEMEKLTINDILHLRLVSNAQYPRDFPHLEDTAVADVSDAADSGYFPHPDDSKPDRWTGDASLFSDFEDEFQQHLGASANPSPEPQDTKSPVLWSPEPSGLWWEAEPDLACIGPDNNAAERLVIPSEDSISQHLFSDSDTQSFRTMCKTATVQNLQILGEEAQSSMPLPVTVGGEDESSMRLSLQQRLAETCSLAPAEHGNDESSLPLPLLFGKASAQNYVVSFPEMSNHLFCEDEAKMRLPDRASPIVCSLSETNLSDRASPIVVSLSETNLSDRAAPILCPLSETSLTDRACPTVYSISETNLSDRASPIVVSLSETNLSDRADPILCSLSETSLSDRASPTVYSISETNLPDRASPIVCSLSETNLSDRASPIVVSLSETNLSDRAAPILCPLSETSLTDRACPTVYSISETNLSDRASPIVVSLSETNLSDRADPILCSLSETSLSDRASPTVYSISETNLSDRASPIVVSLSETNLSGRASPIVCSLSEMSLSDRASPLVYSLSETRLSDRASPIICSLSETNLSDRASPNLCSLSETSLRGRSSPIVFSLSETNLSDRASPTVYSISETNLSDRASPIVVSISETNLSDRASPLVYSLSETRLSDRASPIICSLSETSLTGRSSPIVSLCDRAPSSLSLPETYDYFFSDYDSGDVFFSPMRRLSNHTDSGVPIFSCSVKRDFQYVEEYDFFFPGDSPVESEDEDRHSPIHVVTRFEDQAHDPLDTLVGTDAYEHLFTGKYLRGNLFWRNLLSLRRLRFTGGLYSSHDRSSSWACAVTDWRERSSLLRTTEPGHIMDDRGTSYPHPNIYLENQLCNEFREQRDTDMQTVVSLPKKAFLFTLKQSDICLVCIAFASWVLKSANPQSADTWKTALLANVSAISAIQYLRRYMREGGSENRR
ncbi:uncharacterized protein LOC133110419 isoform X2 [Conger conger]|nr:uncharacterized protein LOC133110419 isoform X2 [Conger conger]